MVSKSFHTRVLFVKKLIVIRRKENVRREFCASVAFSQLSLEGIREKKDASERVREDYLFDPHGVLSI